MPQTVIFLEDLGLGEKGIAEMLAPVSIRRLTLCFSIVSKTRGSPAFMVSQEPGSEVPGPIIRWEPGTVCLPLFSPKNGAGSQR
jgi:hypothetical protein